MQIYNFPTAWRTGPQPRHGAGLQVAVEDDPTPTVGAVWSAWRAVQDAVRARAELARRYLRRKAELLGRARLGWSDLLAPLPRDDARRAHRDFSRVQARIDATYASSRAYLDEHLGRP